MKKLNTTYLDNLVSKILKETLEEKADSIVSKIKGNMCEQCGGNMVEGECNECGGKYSEMEEGIYDVSGKFPKHQSFDYVEETEDFEDEGDFGGEESTNNEDNEKTCIEHIKMFGEDDEVTQKLCQGINITESLRGRRRRQSRKSETDEGNAFTGALSQARKSGDDNFEVDGKKFETKEGKKSETDEGNAFSGALSNAKKSGEDSFEVDGKKYPVKESYRLTETELVSMIEKIVLEQKTETVEKTKETKETKLKPIGGTPKGYSAYEKAHKGSGKENEDYIKDVTKKMKDYLKDGSKGEYSMNPKTFPVGNGELEKMDKKAFQMTDDLEDFNYEIAGLNLPTPDAIEFNEDWMEKLYKGDSKTGNAPGGNALESKTNDRFNNLRKKNTLKKLKDQSYKRVPQPVFNEKSGTEKGKGVNIKLESIEDKKTKQINEEFQKIKQLISYDRKTQ
jgi:hypothetical protein